VQPKGSVNQKDDENSISGTPRHASDDFLGGMNEESILK
jgi:hypothetical protein